LESKLKERREVETKKANLQLFINFSKSVSKIEKLLKDHSAGAEIYSDVLTKENDEETGNLIERVANEFNQLKFYVSKGKNYPFVKNMMKVSPKNKNKTSYSFTLVFPPSELSNSIL